MVDISSRHLEKRTSKVSSHSYETPLNFNPTNDHIKESKQYPVDQKRLAQKNRISINRYTPNPNPTRVTTQDYSAQGAQNIRPQQSALR